jgi:histidinol-phosphatase
VKHDPAWGTHVALEVDGELVLGVITRPVREQRWWGTRGGGAFTAPLASALASGSAVHVSAVDDLAQARIGVWARLPAATVGRLEQATVVVDPTLENILEVISGDLEAVVGAQGKIWDHAPAVVIIGEAGGVFRDHQGGQSPAAGWGSYTNGLVDTALAALLDG